MTFRAACNVFTFLCTCSEKLEAFADANTGTGTSLIAPA
nr:MAG TPA_asm: hypothetical protein [Caudoviricetes sp.]